MAATSAIKQQSCEAASEARFKQIFYTINYAYIH
jgi:hypothetical protein